MGSVPRWSRLRSPINATGYLEGGQQHIWNHIEVQRKGQQNQTHGFWAQSLQKL